MKPPQRLVVRGVNWLGDAVMTLPALARLREALPATHITLLTAEKLADLWRGHPSIDDVLSFAKPQGIGNVSRALREGRFDASLIFPNSFRSALEPWMAGIRTRIGYRASGRGLLLTHAVPPRSGHVEMRKRSAGEIKRLLARHPAPPRETFPAASHHLHQYLRLVSALGASEAPLAPSLPIPPEEAQRIETTHRISRGLPRVGLNAGAEYGPAKRWPVERFVETAAKVLLRRKATFVLFGGPNDIAAVGQLESGIQGGGGTVVNLAGKTTLRELAAALSLCQVVLTNDTGPMHLAAAAGTRVVVPFGSTSPELTGPGLPGDNRHLLLMGQAPCAPCFLRTCPADLRCLRSITPDQAADAIVSTLPA